MNSDLVSRLVMPAETKIVMFILDGLGGLPLHPGGKTELESASKPNLNALARRSSLGLSIPIAQGITPGSGPGHLALFGYDPCQYEIGRGAMEALGVDFELCPDDLAARGNFCTLSETGMITDRRAGRISTETSQDLIQLLRSIKIEGVEIFLEPIKEHRFAFIIRGQGLHDSLTETDPQKINVTPLNVCPLNPDSEQTATFINQFIASAQSLLRDRHPANMILLRGFANPPALPGFKEKYGLDAAAIAVNGMYRGVARLVGMQVLDVRGKTITDELNTLEEHWDKFNFFYIHFKDTDTCGERGDFEGKVKAIEQVDRLIPRLLALNPDVLIISGDHSSPATMKSHSWHPVPTLLHSPYVRPNEIAEFGEQACSHGSLGTFYAKDLMSLALAHAQRLAKYGA